MYDYDHRTATGDRLEDDTEQLFNGFYARGQSPKKALDELVKAYRKPVEEFNKLFHAQVQAGDKMTGQTMKYTSAALHKLIVKHLLDNYGMERSLANGFASQIVHGENY